MTLAKTLLAAALPLVLSAGCALDMGTSAEGLTTETNSDFGINACGQTLQKSLQEAEWSLDTIIAGDMEFTKEDLQEYMETNPGFRTDLIAEMAAVQLNMAVGLVIPDDVLDGLVSADDFLMAPKDDDGSVPPLVAIEDFRDLRSFNRNVAGICFEGDGQVAAVAEGVEDVRDNTVFESEGTVDLRADLATKR